MQYEVIKESSPTGFYAISLPNLANPKLADFEQPLIKLKFTADPANSQIINYFTDYAESIGLEVSLIEKSNGVKILQIKADSGKNNLDQMHQCIYFLSDYLKTEKFSKYKTARAALKSYSTELNRYLEAKRKFRFFEPEIPDTNNHEAPCIKFKVGKGEDNVWFWNLYYGDTIARTNYSCEESGQLFYEYTINGRRSVLHAIKMIDDMKHEDDAFFREDLNNYGQQIKQYMAIKNEQYSLPIRTKQLNEFEKIEEFRTKSSHKIFLMSYHGKIFYLKLHPANRKIAEYEAAISLLNILMAGDNAVEVFCVVDENGNRFTASEAVRGFRDFYSLSVDKLLGRKVPSAKQLMENGLAKLYPNIHARRENDLHAGNLAINELGQVLIFDYDQSFWEELCKYSGTANNQLYTINYNGQRVFVTPATAFPITANDIYNLPHYSDAKPNNNLVKEEHYKILELDKIVEDFELERIKYKYYLKNILIGADVLSTIAESSITSPKGKKIFSNMAQKSIVEFRAALLSMPAFHYFIINCPEFEQELIAEFEEFNKRYQDNYLSLTVDTKKISYEYQTIKNICLAPTILKKKWGEILADLRTLNNPALQSKIVELQNKIIDLYHFAENICSNSYGLFDSKETLKSLLLSGMLEASDYNKIDDLDTFLINSGVKVSEELIDLMDMMSELQPEAIKESLFKIITDLGALTGENYEDIIRLQNQVKKFYEWPNIQAVLVDLIKDSKLSESDYDKIKILITALTCNGIEVGKEVIDLTAKINYLYNRNLLKPRCAIQSDLDKFTKKIATTSMVTTFMRPLTEFIGIINNNYNADESKEFLLGVDKLKNEIQQAIYDLVKSGYSIESIKQAPIGKLVAITENLMARFSDGNNKAELIVAVKESGDFLSNSQDELSIPMRQAANNVIQLICKKELKSIIALLDHVIEQNNPQVNSPLISQSLFRQNKNRPVVRVGKEMFIAALFKVNNRVKEILHDQFDIETVRQVYSQLSNLLECVKKFDVVISEDQLKQMPNTSAAMNELHLAASLPQVGAMA